MTPCQKRLDWPPATFSGGFQPLKVAGTLRVPSAEHVAGELGYGTWNVPATITLKPVQSRQPSDSKTGPGILEGLLETPL